jgi:hypothetical protein
MKKKDSSAQELLEYLDHNYYLRLTFSKCKELVHRWSNLLESGRADTLIDQRSVNFKMKYISFGSVKNSHY